MSMQVISWEKYVSENKEQRIKNKGFDSPPPLAVTIGVFDGVHLGHQALIQRICNYSHTPLPHPEPSKPGLHCSLFTVLCSLIPTVVTFKQNPLKILSPDSFAGDILTLEQKLSVLEGLGVKMAVLIDFSREFCKINGRDFIDLLLGCRPVKLIILGRNFRCGRGLDTGAEEIRGLAGARGVETEIVEPVMDGGRPVSSSRIREALAAGRIDEAQRLLGRPVDRRL